MEIIPYLIAAAMFLLLVYWSAANATAKPGDPSFGLFRYAQSTEDQKRERKVKLKQQRPRFQPQPPDRAGPGASPGRIRSGGPGGPARLPRR